MIPNSLLPFPPIPYKSSLPLKPLEKMQTRTKNQRPPDQQPPDQQPPDQQSSDQTPINPPRKPPKRLGIYSSQGIVIQ